MDLDAQATFLHGLLQDVLHIEWLSTALTAVLAIAFTAVVARLVTKFLRKLLAHDNSPLPSSSIFVNIARVIVWCIGASVVLSSCFNVDVSGAITALGIGGIAISLGFQDTLSNLIGGVQVSITGLVEPGDYIAVGGESGIVEDVTWRHTSFKNASGEKVVVPNSVINKSALVHKPPLTKVAVKLLVAVDGSRLDEVAEQIKAAAEKATKELCALTEPAALLFTEATEYGYRADLIVYMDDASKNAQVKDAIVRAVAPYTRGE